MAAGPLRLGSAAVLHPRAASRGPGCPPRSGCSPHAPQPGPVTEGRVGAPPRSSHGAGPEAALTPPRGRGRPVPPGAARGPLPAAPVPAARGSQRLRVPTRSSPPLPAPRSPSQPASPARRHGGHLPAPGRVCLQLHRVDRGGGGHRHQRLGGDLRLHHHHLPQNGRAGLQGAVGGLRHGDGPLPLQAAGGHPHPARLRPGMPSADDRRLRAGPPRHLPADHRAALHPYGPRAWRCQVPPLPAGGDPHHPPGHVWRGGHHLVPCLRPPRNHHHELRLLPVHGLDRLCPLPLRRLHHRLLLGGCSDLRREPLLLRLGLQLPHPR